MRLQKSHRTRGRPGHVVTIALLVLLALALVPAAATAASSGTPEAATSPTVSAPAVGITLTEAPMIAQTTGESRGTTRAEPATPSINPIPSLNTVLASLILVALASLAAITLAVMSRVKKSKLMPIRRRWRQRALASVMPGREPSWHRQYTPSPRPI